VQLEFQSGGITLRGHLARPAPAASATSARCGLILCHGFPAEPPDQRSAPQSYPELADRLAEEAGWTVLAFDFRGAGQSDGDFSLAGWLADIDAAVSELVLAGDVEAVWLAGFSTGGALALCAAGEDERIRGVATFAAPAEFDGWAADPRRFLAHARSVGVVRDKAFPADFDAWARELREIRPINLIGKVPPRPVLLVHGADDDVVPVTEARALADAADNKVELRVLAGAGHRLRHDPRAVAVLLGWLDRQHV
jgi:pimeloyl-ACP methyl ester carboxylesterase